MLRDTGLSAEQQRMIGTIRDSAFSLLEIINDILDFSKIEAGKMELEIESVSLLSILEKTIEVLWFNAASKNVFLNILPDLNLPAFIRLDPVRIRQIVLNLVGNAIKFTHSNRQQGLVMLRTECRQSHDNHSEMILEVLDNGVGMTKAQLRQLFEPFTQADSSTTRKYGGTGLGLSITKSFVDLMGGKIEVESQPDAGSTFRLRLPCEAADEYRETELQRYSELNIKLLICIDNIWWPCCTLLNNSNWSISASIPGNLKAAYLNKPAWQNPSCLSATVTKLTNSIAIGGKRGCHVPCYYSMKTRLPLRLKRICGSVCFLVIRSNPRLCLRLWRC
ncbi:MAG: hypothetical protein Sw2LagTSB_36910 [Shewanella algae]